MVETFEDTFHDSVGSCRATCACGKTYFENAGCWDWEEDELESLNANPNATEVDGTPGYISFEGTTYVTNCDCWKPRAEKIAAFLEGHGAKIIRYLNARKKEKMAEAAAMPEGR